MTRFTWVRTLLLYGIFFIWSGFMPQTAFAQTFTPHFVDSYDEAPMTDAYLDHINNRKPDAVALGDGIKSFTIDDHTYYCVANTSYVSPSAPRTIPSALELTYKNAGTTLAGEPLDLSMLIDVTWCHSKASEAGNYPYFLVSPSQWGGAIDFCAGVLSPQGTKINNPTGSYRNGISLSIHYKISYAESHKPYPGKVIIWFNDLDQWYGGQFARESIKLMDGFAPDTYVLSNTKLDTTVMSQGLYQPKDSYGDDGPQTSVVAYIQGGQARLVWQGEGCGTDFRARFPATYPSLEDTLYKPEKRIASVEAGSISAPDDAQVKPGSSITFHIHQYLPYVVEENKPTLLKVVDVFDPCFDVSHATLSVNRCGEDVSGFWKLTTQGQSVEITALDTQKATLDLEFDITVGVREDAQGTATNSVSTFITTRTKENIEQTSNTVTIHVLPKPTTLHVYKHIAASGVNWEQGDPVFPVSISVETKDGTIHWQHGVIHMTQDTKPTDEGEFVEECSFDLSRYRYLDLKSVTLQEKPTLRYVLESLASPDASASTDGSSITWDCTLCDQTDLAAHISNKKKHEGLFTHNAHVENRVETS